MDKANEKAFSVTIEKAAETPTEYDYFLMKTTEDALEIDLALKRESEEKVELIVQQSFSIPADKMLSFCLDLLRTLQKYEQKYQNGKGLSIKVEQKKETDG